MENGFSTYFCMMTLCEYGDVFKLLINRLKNSINNYSYSLRVIFHTEILSVEFQFYNLAFKLGEWFTNEHERTITEIKDVRAHCHYCTRKSTCHVKRTKY